MRIALAGIILAVASVPAAAQTLSCTSQSYCDGATCRPSQEELAVSVGAGGDATLQWLNLPRFSARVLDDGPTLVVAEVADNGTASLLVVGESGQATFSTTTDFGRYVLSAFYTLTCREGA